MLSPIRTQNVKFDIACGHKKEYAFRCPSGSKNYCSKGDFEPGKRCQDGGTPCGPVSHGELVVKGKSKQSCLSSQTVESKVSLNFDFDDQENSGTLTVDLTKDSKFGARIHKEDVSSFVSQWLSSTGTKRAVANVTQVDVWGTPEPYKFVAQFNTVELDVPSNKACRPCCGEWESWGACDAALCDDGFKKSKFLPSSLDKSNDQCPTVTKRSCSRSCTTGQTTTPTTTTTTTTTVTSLCTGYWVETPCEPVSLERKECAAKWRLVSYEAHNVTSIQRSQ